MNRYKFDKQNHIHELDGKPLMGITTVLSVISKPALIQWAASMACNYVDEARRSEGFKLEDLEKILKEARTAHRRKRDKAGDFGTLVHEAIEVWIKENKLPTNLDESQMAAFNNFKNWADENKVEFLESEKHVWSESDWLGGILDMVAMYKGKKVICDIKTSSGIYPEMWAQMGGYHLCLKDMGEHEGIEGYLIINLKKTGEIDFGYSDKMQFNQDFFKAALQLYKLKKVADESIASGRDV